MNHPATSADDTLFPVRRLTIAVPSVREFQRDYEKAVPAAPLDEVVALVRRRASWSEMEQLVANSAPHGFLIYFKNDDVHPALQLAGHTANCFAYLMGNHIFVERMFRHDPRVMLYAPLRTVILEDSTGTAWFCVDQPSTLFSSFGIPEISKVGVELDRKLAALLDALHVDVPSMLLES